MEASAIRCRLSGGFYVLRGSTAVKPAVSTGNFPDKSFAAGHVLMRPLCRAGRIFTHSRKQVSTFAKI